MPKSRKEKDSFDPQHMKPEDVLKFEIASELGLADKVISGGWRSLTAKESGRIGGLMTKRKKEMRAEDCRQPAD
ncbi:MAG: small, acid-soluble spore protein, alpha/beta type [Lachnospiraceae bacterium]|nr:small, acid-soluble spore protein, alpha/beta type [Lachnospiraceae bacterium]